MKYLIMMALLGFSSVAIAQSAVELVNGDRTAEQILEDLEGLDQEVDQVNMLGKMVPRKFATIRFLDRLNGDVVELQLARGDKLERQFISVTLKNCFVPRNNPRSDAAAYLVVQDSREQVPAFEGWMIASSPALSALDHPRYDVWVVSCADEGISAVSAAGVLPPPARDADALNVSEGTEAAETTAAEGATQ